jgi:signal transduction histidine kinase
MEGMTALLLDDCADKLDPSAREYGERIRGSAARMDQMIQELLAYSRLTLMAVESEPVPLDRAVNDGIAQVSWELESRKARLNVRKSNHQVTGNYAILVQVVANLVSNAVKFVAEGTTPEISIYDEEQDGAVRLWIVDNGIGIAKEHQDRIFRIFERLHSREMYPGTGIGLAIVNKAISRMNGQMGLESELGQGSRFWIELPIYNSEPDSKPQVPTNELEPA